MWKPGQLVTIRGIVYRVKRKHNGYVCKWCALDEGIGCIYPDDKRYLLRYNCYLIRVSP